MKSILKIFLFIVFLVCYSCTGLQMVETTSDVHKLKANEQQFIGKPLKNLLREIKPEIKAAWATNDYSFYFSFRFRTSEQIKKNQGSWDDRVSLYVYVRERIDWEYEKRPKGKEIFWTKEDVKKFGDLIVVRVKVISPSRD